MKKIFYLILIVLIIFSTGCNSKYVRNSNINDNIKNVISDIYVNNIRYEQEEIDKIYEISKQLGIDNPYIPTKGVLTDFILDIKSDENSLSIVFPHFSVVQSLNDDFIDKHGIIKNVKLDVGDANWILKGGVPSNIYVKINNLYVGIKPRYSLKQENFEAVLNSINQLHH